MSSQQSTSDSDEPETEWRFSIDEVGPEAETSSEQPERGPIEPESISPEHASFVAFGVLITVLFALTAL